MTVLGIDTSNTESAFVIWDGSLIASGKIPNDELCDLITLPGYDLLAVEAPTLFGKSVYPDIMETAIQAGVFMGIGKAIGKDVERYSRQETSLYCSGDRSCKGTKLKMCLIERLGPTGTKKKPGPLYGIVGEDQWDALAVAFTAHNGGGRP